MAPPRPRAGACGGVAGGAARHRQRPGRDRVRAAAALTHRTCGGADGQSPRSTAARACIPRSKCPLRRKGCCPLSNKMCSAASLAATGKPGLRGSEGGHEQIVEFLCSLVAVAVTAAKHGRPPGLRGQGHRHHEPPLGPPPNSGSESRRRRRPAKNRAADSSARKNRAAQWRLGLVEARQTGSRRHSY